MPHAKGKPQPSALLATQIDAAASFFAKGFLAHYSLYQFVLTQPRPQEHTVVEDFVEVPYAVPFHGAALPGVQFSC